MTDCTRQSCANEASVVLSFSPVRATAWLTDISEKRPADGIVLCRKHANGITVPMGWQLVDNRGEGWQPASSVATLEREVQDVLNRHFEENPEFEEALADADAAVAQGVARGKVPYANNDSAPWNRLVDRQTGAQTTLATQAPASSAQQNHPTQSQLSRTAADELVSTGANRLMIDQAPVLPVRNEPVEIVPALQHPESDPKLFQLPLNEV